MRYVIAIGGNALSSGRILRELSSQVVRLFLQGNEVIITHGNGPQVGKLAFHGNRNLALLTRETQVEIGSEIARSLHAADKKVRIGAKIVMTHVLVDRRDKEFRNPSKPVGRFYTEREAKLLANKGFVMKHMLDGYRRVVPSPSPRKIMEINKIANLLARRKVVIAAGGGGIPVFKKGSRISHANAVIDKDSASALLAIKLNADRLIILTKVSGVFLNFETKRQKLLRKVSAAKLRKYAKQGYFEAGSMLPKVKSCIHFVEKTGNIAVIGNLANPKDVFALRKGTVVT